MGDRAQKRASIEIEKGEEGRKRMKMAGAMRISGYRTHRIVSYIPGFYGQSQTKYGARKWKKAREKEGRTARIKKVEEPPIDTG